MVGCSNYAKSLTRKKTLDPDQLETKLDRCYTLSDLVCMGIGYMVGTGIFVLTGEVVRKEAGDAAIISYMFAGIASTLSAVCYAEFAAMVPVSGSGYVYTYVVVGEIWAFIVGWNMVLEYVIGAASSAKSWSGTLDSMANNSISAGIEAKVGSFGTPVLSPYPDFIAFLIVAVVTVFVCISARTSSNFNKVMVTLKLGTIAIIVIAGLTLVDIDNWTHGARGGFAPFGIAGIFKGAATCFYAYVGFDGIAIASEETKNPKKTVPVSIIVSMVIVTTLYILTTIVLTLMVPYYEVDVASPFSTAFAERGMAWAQYVVGVGSMFGLTSVILSGLFSLPRLLYAMSNDGLIFRAFSVVNEKTQTPILPIILTGIVSGMLAMFLDLSVLVELLSIGTLISFTFVAACINLLRYTNEPLSICERPMNEPDTGSHEDIPLKNKTSNSLASYSATEENKPPIDAKSESNDSDKEPLLATYKKRFRTFVESYDKENLVLTMSLASTACMVPFLLLFILAYPYIKAAAWWTLVLLILLFLGILLPLFVIATLKKRRTSDSFQVPGVPFIPALSVFCNLGLMMMLQPMTWVRVVIWLVLGFLIYFFYGVKHSNENQYIDVPSGEGLDEVDEISKGIAS